MLTLLGIAVIVVGLDLLTKTLAVALLDPGVGVNVIGDAVQLYLVRNSGAAFSMASGYTWILSCIALVVVVVIVRYSGRLRSAWWVLGLGMVLGGAIGNLVDRIFRAPQPLQGHVVDFVKVGWWPVFNVADPCVVGGAALLVVLSLLGYDFDTPGRRAVRGKDAAEPAAPVEDDSAATESAEKPAENS